DKMEAEIRFDHIDPDIVVGEHFGQWEDIREAFNTGEMPPEREPQPTPAERDVITVWLDAEFKKAKQYGNPNKRGSVRRLTRYELQYALEDLLGVSAKQEVGALPAEGTSVDTGLQNSSRMLLISGPHLESYLNVIISVINKMKAIAAFEPYREHVDIENLDTEPPVAFTSDKKKIKPIVGKVARSGKGVVVNPGGYIDLRIQSISKYKFQTILAAKAERPGKFEVSIGFTHSEVDPRQKVAKLGFIDIDPGDELRTYTLDSFPEVLPDEMTRALDRPFFIRISNRGRQAIYLEAFDYRGNVNTELTASLIPGEIDEAEIEDHVRNSIAAFVEKAFRRAPTEVELQKYYGVYQRQLATEDAISALLSAYKEILCSPRFFYLGLPGEVSEHANQNFKLAERLAFFLWCSVPDQELLQLALSGNLKTPSVLAAQVDRMIRDEKATRWVEQFTDQWLQTSKLFNVAVDRGYYPKFKDSLKPLMRRETIEAVNDVFRNGSSALGFLKADHVFVNQQLATFYQIKGVRGDEFRKVKVEEAIHRGGLLTQGTFLVGNSDGMNSHAVLRGVGLAEVILNDPPPDPPKNVPPFDASIPEFEKLTLNEKLFAHRDNEACRNCHQKIDPWGIPFENYDASGAWRDQVLLVSKAPNQPRKRRKPVFEKSFLPIDREATLPGGVAVDGVGDLKQYLVQHRQHDFAKGLAERVLAYALSRDIDYYDEDLVHQLCNAFEANDYSVPALIVEIVQSESFQRGY
ncbi:MAG: DUF1592 domain-containing protein, partial [Rubripirellula sp.]|nr:DUF1592 domain-containing protein [Rubripirellula sp.]